MKLDYYTLDTKKAVSIYLSHGETCNGLIEDLKKNYKVFVFNSGSEDMKITIEKFVRAW